MMSFWAEDVTEIHFRVCLREMVSFSGTHDNLYLVSVLSSLFFFKGLVSHQEFAGSNSCWRSFFGTNRLDYLESFYNPS